MKLVKQTDEYTIYQRRDERYAVEDANKQPVNGDAKVRILVEEDLIKAAIPAGAFSVCVIVDGGDAPLLQDSNLVRVADSQVLLVLQKSLWKRDQDAEKAEHAERADAEQQRVLRAYQVPQPPVGAQHPTC